MVPDGPFRGVPGDGVRLPSAVAASGSAIKNASGRRPLASGMVAEYIQGTRVSSLSVREA